MHYRRQLVLLRQYRGTERKSALGRIRLSVALKTGLGVASAYRS